MILIRSIQEKSYKNVNVSFNILVLHLMLLMRGRRIKVHDEGWEQVVDIQDTQIVNEMEDSQSSASASSNMVTTPPPLTPCMRPKPGKRCIMVLIREMLLRRNYLK